ncbi:MAG: DUF853 domain-containing protein [Proteobacteria bacterium]|nr:DUF853 domain-containing protein [Pseudomonadota bacterium]
MSRNESFIIGGENFQPVIQLGRMSNRHGMIAGATGTGKTVTLQVMAEGFSRMGVPVFAADIKGDLSGLAAAGKPHPKIDERLKQISVVDYQQFQSPVVFWDVYGVNGHPIRTTISEMGPLLLANLLELNDTQEGALYAAFRIADDQGLLMLDLKDLKAMIAWMADNAKKLRSEYGNLAPASIGSIQRSLMVLEEQGGDRFFGEPAVQINDLMHVDFSGRGVISLLDATRLYAQSPKVYTAFMLWILSELFEQLPEQGDADRPRMVLFFDEAHLIFKNAPKPLLDKVEQVVRLIRSKGVGIYFISQSPTDIPETVMGQLGLKIQHALRAFTPRDRQSVKTIAANFRTNPAFDTEKIITELGIGEALVSTLDEKGVPLPVRRTLIAPPQSQIGPLEAGEHTECMNRSPLRGRYDNPVDRESAYELLKTRTAHETADKAEQPSPKRAAQSSPRQSIAEAFIKSAARSIGSQIGSRIIRGVLGSVFGGGRR